MQARPAATVWSVQRRPPCPFKGHPPPLLLQTSPAARAALQLRGKTMADGSSDESSIVDNRASSKRRLDSARTARTEMEESWHDMSSDEEDLIEKLHNLLGDRWELISGRLPNRTAAEVEKYWTTKERKKFMQTKLFRPIGVRPHPRLKTGTAESSKRGKS